MKRAVWALVIGLPLILVLATGFGRDPSAIVSPLLNKPAPAFDLPSIDNSPVALDPGQQTVLKYGVVKLPETYFIDRHGIIRYKSLGTVTPSMLNQQIGRLLRTA